jgi:hypothetical protein
MSEKQGKDNHRGTEGTEFEIFGATIRVLIKDWMPDNTLMIVPPSVTSDDAVRNSKLIYVDVDKGMRMFSDKELRVFLERGIRTAVEVKILEQVRADEPEMMLYWAYRKRIRFAPADVSQASAARFFELEEQANVPPLVGGDHIVNIHHNVCEAIWGKLSDEERREWLLKVESGR